MCSFRTSKNMLFFVSLLHMWVKIKNISKKIIVLFYAIVLVVTLPLINISKPVYASNFENCNDIYCIKKVNDINKICEDNLISPISFKKFYHMLRFNSEEIRNEMIDHGYEQYSCYFSNEQQYFEKCDLIEHTFYTSKSKIYIESYVDFTSGNCTLRFRKIDRRNTNKYDNFNYHAVYTIDNVNETIKFQKID